MSDEEPKVHPNGLDEIARLMKQVDGHKHSLELTIESLRKADLELIGELRADNRKLYEENARLQEKQARSRYDVTDWGDYVAPAPYEYDIRKGHETHSSAVFARVFITRHGQRLAGVVAADPKTQRLLRFELEPGTIQTVWHPPKLVEDNEPFELMIEES